MLLVKRSLFQNEDPDPSKSRTHGQPVAQTTGKLFRPFNVFTDLHGKKNTVIDVASIYE
jgi:hypothetical protein